MTTPGNFRHSLDINKWVAEKRFLMRAETERDQMEIRKFIEEAKIGDRITCKIFSGSVVHKHIEDGKDPYLCVLRDDGYHGGGCEHTWLVATRFDAPTPSILNEQLKCIAKCFMCDRLLHKESTCSNKGHSKIHAGIYAKKVRQWVCKEKCIIE